jgi:hypothetical protein
MDTPDRPSLPPKNVARAFQPEHHPGALVVLRAGVCLRDEWRSRRAADGSPQVSPFSVARAFQPEICPFAALWGESLTRSREAAKARRLQGAKEAAKGRWSVFEYEYEYRPPGRTEYEYERGISVLCSAFGFRFSVFGRAADGSPRVCEW